MATLPNEGKKKFRFQFPTPASHLPLLSATIIITHHLTVDSSTIKPIQIALENSLKPESEAMKTPIHSSPKTMHAETTIVGFEKLDQHHLTSHDLHPSSNICINGIYGCKQRTWNCNGG